MSIGRRTTLVLILAACWQPRLALPQPARKLARIGWLSSGGLVNTPSLREPFIAAMRERGWIEGQNFTIDELFSEGHNEQLPAMAAELVRRKVDVIVTAGTPPTAAARHATSTIPIVFFFTGDPVGSGFVASLARPGGNVTGLGGLGPGPAKMLELLREAMPRASRIAILFNSGLRFHATAVAEAEQAARRGGVVLAPVELRAPDELEGVFAAMARERPDAMLVLGQPFMFGQGARLAALALEQQLPAIIPFKEVADAGLLMSYGSRVIDDVRRLPHYIDRILKGTPPGDLPVEQPSRFYLTLNMKTARALGLPSRQSMLQRADEVIQ